MVSEVAIWGSASTFISFSLDSDLGWKKNVIITFFNPNNQNE